MAHIKKLARQKCRYGGLFAAIRALFLLQVVFSRKISMFQNINIGLRFAVSAE